MNKTEKELAKHLIAMHRGEAEYRALSLEEELIMDLWMSLKILDENAFTKTTSGNQRHNTYLPTSGYPFTYEGHQEINKGPYIQFRDSIQMKIARDILAGIIVIASLVATAIKIISYYSSLSP